MSDNWKKPLREIPHHLTTAVLIISMLLFDFAPVVVLYWLMQTSESLIQKNNWQIFGTHLDTIITNIEVFLWIAFIGLGAVKILVRLGFSVSEMGKVKHTP